MSFRDCAVYVFDRLGICPPASYLEDLDRMNEAACEWHKLPSQKGGGVLAFEVPDLTSGVVYTGNLPEAITHGWCLTEPTKDFVRYVDERSGKRGTLLMLQVLLMIQQAVQANKVNAGGGAT